MIVFVLHLRTSCRWEAATICPRPGLQVVTRYTGATENAGLELKGPSSRTGKYRTGIKRTKIAEVENEGRTPTKHCIHYACSVHIIKLTSANIQKIEHKKRSSVRMLKLADTAEIDLLS